jgi:uncharacterized membrane protein required for colicin V production
MGIKRGFVKTVAKPVKIILTLIIAFSFASSFSEKTVEPRIGPSISNQVEDYILEKCGDLTPDNLDEELPTLLKISAGIFDIDIDEVMSESSAEGVVSAIIEVLVSPVVRVVSIIISFVILCLISSIVLSFSASLTGFVLNSVVPDSVLLNSYRSLGIQIFTEGDVVPISSTNATRTAPAIPSRL